MESLVNETIERYKKPCLIGSVSDEEVPIGCSKKGGFPDVSSLFKWPTYKGRPLNFICQVEATILFGRPTEGVVLFFWNGRSWGGSISDRGAFVALHQDVDLKRLTTTPTAEYKIFGIFKRVHKPRVWSEKVITFENSYSCPSLEDLEVALEEDYDDFYCRHLDELTGFFKIGGFPDIIQNTGLEQDCADTVGVGTKDSWKLFLQIDSQDDMNFGDAGRLFWYIDADDIERQNCGNIWMHMQCY